MDIPTISFGTSKTTLSGLDDYMYSLKHVARSRSPFYICGKVHICCSRYRVSDNPQTDRSQWVSFKHKRKGAHLLFSVLGERWMKISLRRNIRNHLDMKIHVHGERQEQTARYEKLFGTKIHVHGERRKHTSLSCCTPIYVGKEIHNLRWAMKVNCCFELHTNSSRCRNT